MPDQLAHHPVPYPIYAELRERGVHQGGDGRWIVARAADIAAVLASPHVAVGFRSGPNDPDGVVQARVARFSDGEDHDRRRAMAVARLADIDPARLQETTAHLARERLEASLEPGPTVDVIAELARPVPAAVLAEELGANPADATAAAAATRELALALAPPTGTPPADLIDPATRLAALLGCPTPETGSSHPADGTLSEEAVNVLALLFQAIDATAGLIGNAVVAADRLGAGTAADLVAETNRFDPPVQLTNRVTTGPLAVGGVTIPAGGRIVVVLAAANHDPAPGQPEVLTFGTGPRPCPGAAHALALATGVVEALLDAGLILAEPTVAYEPRPNLRIPARLTMRRA